MIAIIKYQAGNTKSVVNALERLGYECVVTDCPKTIQNAEKVIFPGVGQAAFAMQQLNRTGLTDMIKNLKQPVLGICLGMQLLCKQSEEGDTLGLGVFPNVVKKFIGSLPVPHMGWNEVSNKKSKLLKGLSSKEDFYFVHSYYVVPTTIDHADCTYITPFCATLERDNFYATQFHPEKSGKAGLQVLKNFLEL